MRRDICFRALEKPGYNSVFVNIDTLRGRVLPIGGLKEKLLAAKNAGVRTVCVPKKNEKDVEEISGEIKKGLEIVYVETMEQVLRVAFCEKKE